MKKLRKILAQEGLIRKASEVVAEVITFGGRKDRYTREDILEFLANPRIYQDADELPKWLVEAGSVDKVRGFPKNFQQALDYLEKLAEHQGRPVVINVQSDDRRSNVLPRL